MQFFFTFIPWHILGHAFSYNKEIKCSEGFHPSTLISSLFEVLQSDFPGKQMEINDPTGIQNIGSLNAAITVRRRTVLSPLVLVSEEPHVVFWSGAFSMMACSRLWNSMRRCGLPGTTTWFPVFSWYIKQAEIWSRTSLQPYELVLVGVFNLFWYNTTSVYGVYS